MNFPVFYIDPGTGSMLFTILIGLLGASAYAVRSAFLKLKIKLSGTKEMARDDKTVPYVIFADDKRYWNVFEPILREFDKRGENAVYMTASPDDPALQEHFQTVSCRFIGEGNKAYARLNMLKADILLATTPGLDVYQWKRSKEVKHYSHILHMASDATLYRMFGLDFFDSILLSGDYQIKQLRALEKMRNLPPKEMVVVGQPYMDSLKKRLDETEKRKTDKKTVLLAPSWGKSSILNRYGEKAIDALLATGYEIIVRPHPQSFRSELPLMEKLMAKYPGIEWNRDNDNFDVLNRADILISDFSGVMFDFALIFNKPVIYADTAFDKAPYDAAWLDEELWTFAVLPKIGMPISEDGFDNIKMRIDTCLSDGKFEKGREEARVEAWCHIGESAERTVSYLIAKRKELLAKEDKV